MAAFLVACLAARGGFLSSADPGDVGRYHDFASRMADGGLPYRSFYMEYPPGAIPAFLAARVAGDAHYNLAFKLEVAIAGLALVVALVAVLNRLARDPVRDWLTLGLFAVSPVALGAVVLNRYDLWPALLVVVALWALLAGRDRLTFGVLAAGCAVKVFPAVIVPVAALHVYRTRGARALGADLLAFAIVSLVLWGPFALVAPGGLGYSVKTQTIRSLQLESLASSALLALDKIGLYAADIVPGKPGSIDLSGALPDALGVVTSVVLLGALALVVLAYRRADESDELLVAGFAASVAAFVAFSKVISPQFLVWLVPLVPLVARPLGRIGAALMLAAVVTTQVEVVYEHPLRAVGWPVWVLAARNAILVSLFVVLLAAVLRGSRRGAREASMDTAAQPDL